MVIDFSGLRIGLVGPVPPPHGGMANQTRQLLGLLQSAGAQPTLIATNPPYRPAWLGRWRGFRAVLRLLVFCGQIWRQAGQVQIFHVMSNSGLSWHLFSMPVLLIARLRQVPVVINYRGGDADEFLQKRAWWVRLGLRRAAALVVPSGFLAAVFSRHGIGANIVPNIIDLQHFSPAKSAEAGANILVARNLEAIYDNATALRAFELVLRRLPHARLFVAGSGPELPVLRELAAELGVAERVEFTGALDRDEMATLMRRCHLMINPSLVDNMPNSVLEAMACGIPIVSTSVGGVPYIVEHRQTGLLVPAADASAMAAAAIQLLTEPGLAEAIVQRATAAIDNYSWSQVAGRWREIYRQACVARASV